MLWKVPANHLNEGIPLNRSTIKATPWAESTLTNGQQPHSPVVSLQQVAPEAQLLLSSHLTSATALSSARDCSFLYQGTLRVPLVQEVRLESQV